MDKNDDLIQPNRFIDKNQRPPEHFPFSSKEQAAVLGHALVDPTFFIQCVARVREEWFEGIYHKRIWAAVLAFHKTHNRRPNDDEMMAGADLRSEDPAFKAAFKAALIQAKNDRQDIGLDVIMSHIDDWMQALIYFNGVAQSAKAWSGKRYSEAIGIVKKLTKDLDSATFKVGAAYDFTKWQADFEADEQELNNALTTGLPALDKAITPQATKGALLIEDTTLILAPVNGGKTQTLCTIACANAKRHDDVLFIMHEGRINEIRNRLLCNLLSRPRHNEWMTNSGLREAYKDPSWTKRLNWVSNEILTEYLVLVPLIRAGITVEETGAVIRQQQDEHMARTGRRFKMVVCDYPGKETTDQARTVKMEWRQRIETVYQYWGTLGGELKTHNVVAWQTNREGFKIARGRGKEERLLDLDDSSECFAVAQPCANVLTCNLDPITKNMTFLVAKGRGNERKIAVTCQSRLGSGMTHHEEMSHTWYEGTQQLKDRAPELLSRFNGQEIDAGELHGW